MKHYILIILCIIFIKIHFLTCAEIGFNKKLSEYLNKEFVNLNSEFLEVTHETKNEDSIDIGYVGNTSFSGDIKSILFSYTLNNITHFLTEKGLYFLNFENELFLIKEETNFSLQTEELVFLKTFDNEKTALLLTGFKNGTSTMYGMNKTTNEYYFVQTFSSANAKDAKFFTSQNDLYLIILTNNLNCSSKTILYKWKNTYFNQHEIIYTAGAIKILSFSNLNSEIIVILHNSTQNYSHLTAYEFKSKKITKTQQIPTENAIHIDSFVHKNENYLVVFEKSGNNTIYTWKGIEFWFWGNLDTKNEVSYITYNNNLNLIFIFEPDNILAYKPTEYHIELTAIRSYNKKFKNIFYVQFMELKNKSVGFIVGKGEDDIISINVLSFKINSTNQDSEEINIIDKCFFDLQQKITIENLIRNSHVPSISKLRKHEEFTEDNSTNIPAPIVKDQTSKGISVKSSDAINKESIIDQTSKLISAELGDIVNEKTNIDQNSKSISVESSDIINEETKTDSIFTTFDSSTNVLEVNNMISDLKLKLNELEPFINSYEANNTSLILNGDIFFYGSLSAKILEAKDLNIKVLNQVNWAPENFLQYSEEQTISGHVHAKQIMVNNLVTHPDDSKFQDLLLKTGDQDLTGRVTVNNKLIAENLYASKINDLLVDDMFIDFNTIIGGVKEFDNIFAEESKIKTINTLESGNILSLFADSVSSDINFDSNIEIDNLIVEEISGINWNDFSNSVFKVGEDDTINGKLHFNKITSEHLHLKTLNGARVSDFMTTSTDQEISSEISFNRIFTQNISANTVNGINLKEQAITFDGIENKIDGPIVFDKVIIDKNLEMMNNNKKSFLKQGEHVIGTDSRDLLQLYNKKVIVKGNLHLKNIQLQPETRFILAGREFNTNIENKYWTKSTAQTIPTHLVMEGGVTTPHLLTKSINNIDVNNYMLTNFNPTDNTIFRFKKATINGNVFINEEEHHWPNLNEIDEEGVKLNGSFVITGKKRYVGTLEVDNLSVPILNGINVSNAVNTKNPTTITGTKTFEILKIKGNLLSDITKVTKMNNYNLKEFFENAVYIDEPQNLDKCHFKSIESEQFKTIKLNEQHISEYILDLEKMFSEVKQYNVYINGDTSINTAVDVLTINDLDVRQLSEKKKLQDNSDILKFSGHVKIDNLSVRNINDIDLEELMGRLLFKDSEQEISAEYTFNKIKTGNIISRSINNISLEQLIDVTSNDIQRINIKNGISFSKVDVKSLFTQSMQPCNIKDVLDSSNFPSTKFWQNVFVKNVTFLDKEAPICRIFENTVQRNKENIITTPVSFSNNIFAQNIISDQHINNIDLGQILEDTIFFDVPEEQVITGQTHFKELKANSAWIEGNADIHIVNDILIPNINQSIIHKDNINNIVIKGTKTFFDGLQTNNFYADEISGFVPENLVSWEDQKTVPNVIFDNIEVTENLNIKFVNNIDVNSVLNDRLLINSPDIQVSNATYFFEDLKIENIRTKMINNISMDNVIFDIDHQIISSPKEFANDIVINRNVNVQLINGKKISETYENALLNSEKSIIDGSVTVLKPSVVNGNIQTEFINRIPFQNILNVVQNGSTVSKLDSLYTIKSAITDIIHSSNNAINNMPSDYMYLEMSRILPMHLPNTTRVKTVKTKDHVLIHVTGEESGNKCGLVDSCKCPIQQTIEMTPEHSINSFLNKGVQRIYTYSDEKMIVNFITNSVSTEENCRTNQSKVYNEYSTMAWSIAGNSKEKGSFYWFNQYITGYISDVDFFSVGNISYAIIGRYYDPVLNTHDLDVLIVRFSEDKKSATQIQAIPTKGVTTIYLLHTMQGVILVIGNTYSPDTYEQSNTQIYKFDLEHEQFNLMRVVPSYGCSNAEGVVLGSDSFIVLSHKEAPIIVLKYDYNYDQYTFYQDFKLDVPVLGISVFYTGGFGISNAYLCIVAGNNNYFIYAFKHVSGWQLESKGRIDGLNSLVPFNLNKQTYLFAPSRNFSSLLTVIKQGPN